MKRLVDFDPLSGVKTYHEYEKGMTTIGYECDDVSPILDVNKEIQNRPQGKYKKEDWWHVAHIPASVIMKWKAEKGVDVFNPDHTKAVERLLNDPDWKYLRTVTGTI